MAGKNKEHHEKMWQYIIDSTEFIFYMKSVQGLSPEKILAIFKSAYIFDHDRDSYESIIRDCYACKEAKGDCSKCPISKKVEPCVKDTSAYNYLLEFLCRGDKENFIKEAKRIRDAWN